MTITDSTLDRIRLRQTARAAKDAIEGLIADPESPDVLSDLNRALVLLRIAFKENVG